MTDAVTASLGAVAYLALFAGVAVLFVFVNLLVGRFLRPADPHPEKTEIYECGEPTIGSSFVQFDLRFYVVALLFIIFDVEVAFFFPWAAVFGKSMNLAEPEFPVAVQEGGEVRLTPEARLLYQELGVRDPQAPTEIPATLVGVVDPQAPPAVRTTQIIKEGARQFAWVTILDIAVFFGVLLVGFAYVWHRGDLDWVRALSQERAQRDSKGLRVAGQPEEAGAALSA